MRKELWIAIATLAVVWGTVQGAEQGAMKEKPGLISQTYDIYVSPSEVTAFETGMKAWLKCYGDHKGAMTWQAYQSMTGELGRYHFSSDDHHWADFDKEDPASKACDDVFNTQVMPHIKRASGGFEEYMPDISRPDEGADDHMGTVYFFHLKGNDQKFFDIIKKINEAANKKNWSHYYWIRPVTTEGHDPDMYVAVPHKNFAAMDMKQPKLWEMVGSVYGKKEAEKMRTEMNDQIKNVDSMMYYHNKDLSYIAPKP